MATFDVLTTDSDQLLVIETNGSRHRVVNEQTGEVQSEWAGAELTGAGYVAGAVVCPALNGLVYIARAGAVDTLRLQDRKLWMHTVLPVSEESCIIAGNTGHFGIVDCADGSATVEMKRLRDYGVSKPGRDILGSFRAATGECFLMGRRSLLLEWKDDAFVECLATTAEVFLHHGIMIRDTLWAVGLQGRKALLLEHTNGESVFHDLPIESNSCPMITNHGDTIIVGADIIYAGQPGSWNPVGELPSESIVRLIVRDNDLLAFSWKTEGATFDLQAHL